MIIRRTIMGRYLRIDNRFFLLVSLITAAICLAGCFGSSEYIKKGRKYAAAEEWDKSVQIFRKAHEEYPDNISIKLMFVKSKFEASLGHMSNGESLLKKNLYNEAISEFQMSIGFNPPNQKAALLINKAKDMRSSAQYARQGQNLMKTKKFIQAREAFQKAIKFNPENKDAIKTLSYFRKKEISPPKFKLGLKSDKPIALKFKKTPIINVFEVLTKLTGINFIFDKDMKESKVTLFMTDVSFDHFFEALLRTNKLSAKLINSNTMIIYPDTSVKVKEYQDLQIRTFYLANIDAKKAVSLLNKILKNKAIIANEKLNSIVIRGPKEVVDIASKIIAANDRAPAEVLLNVEILEVGRTKEKQLGLEFSESVTLGIGERTSGISSDSSLAGLGSLYDIARISNNELLLSLPTATLNLLRQDGDTRILAKPQIRVKNSEKASMLIGERIPLRTNRRVDSTTGDITSDYQYQDIGIKLEAEPTINIHDEITLKLNIEVSALGSNVGTTDDPQYSIKTRNVQSVLTVRDGEAVLIGGLISDEERQAVRKIPLLGDIPLLGKLFHNYNTGDTQTDILMVITPIVTRSQEIPETNVMQIWSGKEKDFSQRAPYESLYEEKYLDFPMEEYFINSEKTNKNSRNEKESQQKLEDNKTSSKNSN